MAFIPSRKRLLQNGFGIKIGHSLDMVLYMVFDKKKGNNEGNLGEEIALSQLLVMCVGLGLGAGRGGFVYSPK